MNFQNINFDYVEGERKQVPKPPSTPVTVIRADDFYDEDRDHVSTASAQPTTVIYAPSQHSATESSSDFYGPDRHRFLGFGTATTAQNMAAPPVAIPRPAFHAMGLQSVPRTTAWEAQFDASTLTGFRDEVLRETESVTPDAPHTPNILYALEAITRDRHVGYAADHDSDDSDDDDDDDDDNDDDMAGRPYPIPGLAVAPASAHSAPLRRLLPAPDIRRQQFRPQQATAQPSKGPTMPAWAFKSALPDTYDRPIPPPLMASERVFAPNHWKCLNGEIETLGLPRLDYRPRLLRWPSFLALMILCALMIVALVACAVYSQLHGGLLPWTSIYGGQYFLFRMLPQTLALGLLLYAQSIITTAQRIIPFVRLASEVVETREGAVMEDLYPPSFLWPHLTGSWKVWVPALMTWLVNATVPLHSAAFTVVLKDGRWVWAATQGVAWTLVALYVGLFASTAAVWAYWARVKVTGLLWDPRSLADVACMISKSNVMAWYRGSKTAATRESIRYGLRRRADDRLAFWAWKDGRRQGQEWWYALGNTKDDANFVPVQSGPGRPKGSLTPKHEHEHVRHRYLPWWLRTRSLLFMVVAAWATLMTVLVVSFLPATRVTAGFPPYLSAAPGPGAFSKADFLYSFIPSALAMILYLAFATLDQHVRVLTPWAALSSTRGAPARTSLLADYAACSLPLGAALHAARDRSWGVAVVSSVTALLALLPVCAGAMFMALTVSATGQVRVFPNAGAFAVVLALLVVMAVALLLLLLSRRGPLRLPHRVTCLAEIVGLLVTDELQADAAFRDCRNRRDLLRGMGIVVPDGKRGLRGLFGRRSGEERADRWALGFPPAAHGVNHVLGVRRVARFTDRRRAATVRKSQVQPVREMRERMGLLTV